MTRSGTILVIGATGFIGRQAARELLDRGFAVRALIRPGSANQHRVDARCDLQLAELSDAAALDRALADIDAVVYGAGTVRGSHYGAFRAANVEGVAALAAALRRRPVPVPLLLISSLAATRPELSDYARSKHDGEHVLTDDLQLPWTLLRPPAVYGPGDRELAPLLTWVRRGVALRPGPREQRLSLLHVEDLARAIACWAADPSPCRHACYAIDDGRSGGYDWRAIALAVRARPALEVPLPPAVLGFVGWANRLAGSLLGYAPMLTPGKARELRQVRWVCDNSAFVRATGWRPLIGLARGARTLLDDRCSNPRPNPCQNQGNP